MGSGSVSLYACFQVTEKDCPSGESADGWAFTTPTPVSMVILSFDHAVSLDDPWCPLLVVKEPEKFTVPKLVSFWTLQAAKQSDGASATHSAVASASPDWVCCVLKVCPVLLF